jgi:hypothetical protein
VLDLEVSRKFRGGKEGKKGDVLWKTMKPIKDAVSVLAQSMTLADD